MMRKMAKSRGGWAVREEGGEVGEEPGFEVAGAGAQGDEVDGPGEGGAEDGEGGAFQGHGAVGIDVVLLRSDQAPVHSGVVVEVEEGLFDGAAVAAEDGEHAAELGDGGEAGGVPGVGG